MTWIAVLGRWIEHERSKIPQEVQAIIEKLRSQSESCKTDEGTRILSEVAGWLELESVWPERERESLSKVIDRIVTS